jgi:hypothetical protein
MARKPSRPSLHNRSTWKRRSKGDKGRDSPADLRGPPPTRRRRRSVYPRAAVVASVYPRAAVVGAPPLVWTSPRVGRRVWPPAGRGRSRVWPPAGRGTSPRVGRRASVAARRSPCVPAAGGWGMGEEVGWGWSGDEGWVGFCPVRLICLKCPSLSSCTCF